MRQLGHREASNSLGDTQVAGGGGGVRKQAAWLFESARLPTRLEKVLKSPAVNNRPSGEGFARTSGEGQPRSGLCWRQLTLAAVRTRGRGQGSRRRGRPRGPPATAAPGVSDDRPSRNQAVGRGDGDEDTERSHSSGLGQGTGHGRDGEAAHQRLCRWLGGWKMKTPVNRYVTDPSTH